MPEAARASTGGNYVINERGRFMLRDGEIAAVEGEPVLVVSDLVRTGASRSQRVLTCMCLCQHVHSATMLRWLHAPCRTTP